MIAAAIFALQALFLLYFLGLNGTYLALNVIALWSITRHAKRQEFDRLPAKYLGVEPPVSILAPAYNEQATIVASVRSLLQQTYGEFEVVVINDGSTDDTLEVLRREFDLEPFPEVVRVRLEGKPIRQIYHAPSYPNLRVIDKENGGKSDALNVGLNCAHFPFYCAVDADSVLQRDSLVCVLRPFLEDPTVIASGGCIRVANGCRIQEGFLVDVGLPRSPLALFQVAEYLRAFLFGRLGWSPLNAMLIISGAFGVFNKERVIEAGGYRTDTVGEDMELVVRLHRLMRSQKRPYSIVFVPDPICWTEVPESLRTLASQRQRWQRGLIESLMLNRELFMHPNGGLAGWLAFPFLLIFECFGPFIEVTGYVFMVVCFAFGLVSLDAFLVFWLLAFGLGILLSITALLLEEVSYHMYRRPRDLTILLVTMVAENLGYRQLMSLYRAWGLLQYLIGRRGGWGEMARTASWNHAWSRTGSDAGKAPS